MEIVLYYLASVLVCFVLAMVSFTIAPAGTSVVKMLLALAVIPGVNLVAYAWGSGWVFYKYLLIKLEAKKAKK